jgi:hypothetical protein
VDYRGQIKMLKGKTQKYKLGIIANFDYLKLLEQLVLKLAKYIFVHRNFWQTDNKGDFTFT